MLISLYWYQASATIGIVRIAANGIMMVSARVGSPMWSYHFFKEGVIYAESDKICLYLQTLSMIPLEKMTKQTQEMLAKMLELVLERMPKQELTEEQKVDIMHDGVVLAASLKSAPSDPPVSKAVKAWEAYANDDAIYNDIKQPWFLSTPVTS